jgi:1,4-alpha-glucan branching enzyme
VAVKGYFTFVLHSHLPYVIAHGKWPHGLDWLNEATAETYIPLLDIFNQLVSEGIMPKVVIGITPVLAEQLADASFKEEFKAYLNQKKEAAWLDQKEFESKKDDHMARLAADWLKYYTAIYDSFTSKYSEDLVGAFRRLQDAGAIEVITSAATHGYLPLIGDDSFVRAQVRTGVKNYKKHFLRPPKGIWLPECAYRPRYQWAYPLDGFGQPKDRAGIEEILYDEGLEYFMIDSHLLKGGKAIGVYLERFKALKTLWSQFEKSYNVAAQPDTNRSPYKIYMVDSGARHKPAAILTRDPKTGLQVWSGEWGYPGDGNYLDFHKKRFPGGLRYWKITSAKSDLGSKMVYWPDDVPRRLQENADHFVGLVKETLAEFYNQTGTPGIVVSPFDSELFGHWWFEGPRWIYLVLKGLGSDPELQLTTGTEAIDKMAPMEMISIPEGSWGEGGFHWIWFNDWTRWTWQHLYEAEAMMKKAARFGSNGQDANGLYKQLAREFLLLESSDWQFLISTFNARDYAELRFNDHLNRFKRLYEMAERSAQGAAGGLSAEDLAFLGDCQKRDALFDEVDFKDFA